MKLTGEQAGRLVRFDPFQDGRDGVVVQRVVQVSDERDHQAATDRLLDRVARRGHGHRVIMHCL
jgi:hypothetical protein